MSSMLLTTQSQVKQKVAYNAADINMAMRYKLRMARPVPNLPADNMQFHYIAEWAVKRGLRQTDIAAELNIEKSTVGRWFRGTVPTETYLVALSKILNVSTTGLFVDPEEYAILDLFRGRSAEERARMVTTLNAAFPRNKKQG